MILHNRKTPIFVVRTATAVTESYPTRKGEAPSHLVNGSSHIANIVSACGRSLLPESAETSLGKLPRTSSGSCPSTLLPKLLIPRSKTSFGLPDYREFATLKNSLQEHRPKTGEKQRETVERLLYDPGPTWVSPATAALP